MSKMVFFKIIIFGFLLAVVDSTQDTFDVNKLVVNGANQSIKVADARNTSQQILLSKDGGYALQFFPYQNNTQRLLVILSTRFNTTVVWIANRDKPVSWNASLLLHLPSRSLALEEGNGTLIWSSPVNNISAIVMNSTGNLYILAGADIAWQSFDEPTDVFVPGQRLLTNHNSTSSLSWNNWASGHYILKADPGGAVLYATFDSQHTTIPYQVFNYVAANSSYSSSLYSSCNHTTILYRPDATGVSLEQEGPISPQCLQEDSNINTILGFSFPTRTSGDGFRFIRLTPTGDISSFFLSNSTGLLLDNELLRSFYGTYCKLPSYCGVNSLCSLVQNCTCPQLFQALDPSDLTQGCRLQTPLNCSIFRQHQFLEVTGADYYANTYGAPRKLVEDAAHCTDLCLENCSCTAAFYNNKTGACHLYDQVRTVQYGSNAEVTAYLRVASLPAVAGQASGKDSIPKQVIIGVSVGVAMAVVILLGFVGWISRRLVKAVPEEESDSEEEAFLESLPGLPPRFSYKELQDATEGFSKRLGAGGSGAVYEGNLHVHVPSAGAAADMKNNVKNNSLQQQQHQVAKVAVKELKLSKYSNIAAASRRQFRAEVATLGNLSHVNLVQLKGFCAEGMHRLLIYEFVENGSLDNWIFADTRGGSPSTRPVLPGEVRYKIAVDTARGLAFLHEECRDKVIHMDVKPQNILLDGGLRAKLADFGLSKMMDRGHSQTVTAMRGTPGYMAPEWFLNMPITDRSDVFSYGMVLLELVGGRKNVDAEAPTSEEWYFPAWALKQAESGRIREAVDKRLLQNIEQELEYSGGSPSDLARMERLLKVAFWCIQEDATSRPSMTTVVLMLDEHLQVPDPPLDMAYIPRLRHTRLNAPSNFSCDDTSRLFSPR